MKKLTLTFKRSCHAGVITPEATAFIELTQKQFDNFFLMRELTIEKNLSALELYIHGVKWQTQTQPMETAEFVVSRTMGVALNAYVLGSYGKPVRSDWVDWGTLDLHYVLGGTECLELVPSHASAKVEDRDVVQLV